ncbi:MAG: hypothetical protein AAF429_12960 [Pseudomonadota bacterium]
MENKTIKFLSSLSKATALSLTTALVWAALPTSVHAQNCQLLGDTLEVDCDHSNAGTTVAREVQPNAELESVPSLGVDGFQISVDGNPVDENGNIDISPAARKSIEATIREQDLALAGNDISVKFDGIDVRPRLNVERTEPHVNTGGSVTFRNRMNYPAFVMRGELILIERTSSGGPRTLAVIPMSPNSTVTINAPSKENVAYVYRVYDQRGRYDETAPASVFDPSRRGAATDVEEGLDTTAKRSIPVNGGAVTVSGRNVKNGSAIRTLGETVQPDNDGDFVIQRILPTGKHLVSVNVVGGEDLERSIDIPRHDLFYIGLADLTVGKRLTSELLDATGEPYDDTYVEGRLAFYVHGKVKGGYTLTASADTGYGDIEDLIKNFDEKNPRSLLDRMDPDEGFPVYGDDSTSEITAPTSGKFFLKVEKGASHVMWGNFKSQIDGGEYLRNERTLYGGQAVYRSSQQTSHGQSIVEVQVYAAQPDTLPQRDVFLGTGGSSYFLKFKDITRGSETILIEIRNPISGQVTERKTLVYGVDYDINYIQGIVILSQPLSSSAADNDLITINPNGDNQAFLVVNYDHTPTSSDVDSFSYGGRMQTWLGDNIRVGLTAMDENLGTSRQKSYGADLLFRISERTFAEFEVARTEGTGLDQDVSVDGGLTIGTEKGATGTGTAYRFKTQADLKELGLEMNGLIGGYFEDREAGFSTLNHRTTVDERLWGVFAELEPTEGTKIKFAHDEFSDATGKLDRETSATLSFEVNALWRADFGLEREEKVAPGDPANTGRRSVAALRLTYQPNDDTQFYVYGQGTFELSGGLERNDRVGIGGATKLNDYWTVSGEISDGTTGIGGRLLATYDRDQNGSYYFGWTLDPDREFGGAALNGTDRGQFVLGARRKLNEDLTVFAENTYDLFGEHKSLTSVYGADYAATDYLNLNFGVEVGHVTDPFAGTDFNRHAFSLGATYRDDGLSATGRIEYRTDKGINAGSTEDAETIAVLGTARYKLNESERLFFSFESIHSQNASASIPNARYTEVSFGYALRPVDNDRLNLLAKYNYIYDMTERVGATPASGANFITTPRQKAHIFNIDASYDLNNHWTLGGKIGGRLSEQDNGSGFVSNNAVLGVLNLRYHIVHKWDALVEFRQLSAEDLGRESGFLAAIYRHVGNNAKIGLGYNFSQFSDDLADVTYDDEGVFLNIVGKF